MPTKKTKKKNGWTVTHIPITSWILFWALVLTTMVLAYLCFANAFVKPASQEVDQASVEAYRAIADNLERQVNEMEVQKIQEAPEIDGPREPSRSSCTFIEGPIDQYVTYTIKASYEETAPSVTMRIPYSTAWWKFGCDYAAATGDRGIVQFGPWSNDGHVAKLVIKPSTSDFSTATGTRRTINGITLFSNVSTEQGSTSNWMAFGRNYAYEITSLGWLTDAEALKIIQSLRVTK